MKTAGAMLVTFMGRLSDSTTYETFDCAPDAGTVEGYVAMPLVGTVKDGSTLPRNTHSVPL